MDQDRESEDAIFNGYIYTIKTPQFNLVNRSQNGKGCDFKQETSEYRGNICFIPTKGYCFVKCLNFIAGEDCEDQYLNFLRKEKRRSDTMTKARIQPFCWANNISIGYIDGTRVFLDWLRVEIMLCFYTVNIFV